MLDQKPFTRLLANPGGIENLIPPVYKDWVIIDEVQRIPTLLNQVHRMIENRKLKFILTGSSARKLRRGGANLLAGRALLKNLYPLTAKELGDQFDLKKALKQGLLPMSYLNSREDEGYLAAYVGACLREEAQLEGLVQNLSTFSRFLEIASFSQGQIINYSKVALESSIERKTVTNYFQILEDLLLAHSLDVFSMRAKRALIKKRKFDFF